MPEAIRMLSGFQPHGTPNRSPEAHSLFQNTSESILESRQLRAVWELQNKNNLWMKG